MSSEFDRWFDELPLIAVLRGIRPDEVPAIVEALLGAGIRLMEIPLNSPSPFEGIARAVEIVGDRGLCGAGTVLDPESVQRVLEAGGGYVVAPNVDPAVIGETLAAGLVPLPGVGSATEALLACASGARYLKLFPASTYGPAHLKALRAVLPEHTRVLAVGGIDTGNIGEWARAGADGYGTGTSLFRPGVSAGDVAAHAAALVKMVRTEPRTHNAA